MTKRFLMVVNVDWFFLSHRLPIALEAQRQGYDVHIAVAITDRLAELQAYGFSIHPLSLRRERAGAASELGMLVELYRLFRREKPDIVHLVTIRPVIYGGIAARLTGVPAVVAAISGLGTVFVARGLRARARRFLVGGLYRIALKQRRLQVIFQNRSDESCLMELGDLKPEQCTYIRGSGADLSLYNPGPMPDGQLVVLMAARLIKEKGVTEYVEAARLLKRRGVDCRFLLAGGIDPGNPASLTDLDVKNISQEGNVEVLGPRQDMPQIINASHIVVLPSYYGEGLPKILIEAGACGRGVVTTDLAGCRDAILPARTGMLVPPRDADALAEKIEILAKDRSVVIAMGKAGRRFAEAEFDVKQVVTKHMEVYSRILPMTKSHKC